MKTDKTYIKPTVKCVNLQFCTPIAINGVSGVEGTANMKTTISSEDTTDDYLSRKGSSIWDDEE